MEVKFNMVQITKSTEKLYVQKWCGFDTMQSLQGLSGADCPNLYSDQLCWYEDYFNLSRKKNQKN